MQVRKAVIPAAGLGTRFLPATKAQPKEMLPLVDTPIIQHVVEEAVASGIQDILIVTGRGKRAIEDHFDRSIELESFLGRTNADSLLSRVRDVGSMVDIHFVRQKEPLGLGHAILQARRHVGDEPFAILLGDDVCFGGEPCIAQLMRAYAETGSTVVGVQEMPESMLYRYGVIRGEQVSDRLYRAQDLVEKPAPGKAPSNMAIIGRYVVEPQIFDILERVEADSHGEIQLTDGLRLLRHMRLVYAYNPLTHRYDVGDKLGYLAATVDLALGRPDLGPEFRQYLLQTLRASGGESVLDSAKATTD